MCNQHLKITRFFPILLILFFISCHEIEYDPNSLFESDEEFQYKTEKAFCQNDPEFEISSKNFYYNKNGNKTEEITYSFGNPVFKITITYNSYNQKLSESVFYYKNDSWELSTQNLYKYSRNRLIEKNNYDSGETLLNKTIYKYSDNRLKYEELYRRGNNDWVFNFAYGYEYNSSGQLAKRLSYQDEAKEIVYDQYVYTYTDGRLATVKRILVTGKTQFFREYSYTRNGLLDEITEDGNTIEKNYYEHGKLIEKHTWYFGIDPGFFSCNGNYILKYGY